MKPERNIEQNSAGRDAPQFVPALRQADVSPAGLIAGRESLDTWLDEQLKVLELQFSDWTTAASLKASFRKGGR